eukprot:m.53943 g.53943  ORF g.53943 m.53943 type:complete len:885 (+) comp34291_c0_seq2:525-3179(+)
MNLKNLRKPNRFVYISCFLLFGLAIYTSIFLTYSAKDPTVDVRLRGVVARRRWQDVAHLQGLLTDMHRELDDAVAERDDLELQLKQILETEDGKHMARWTTVVRPIKSKLPARLRSTPLLGCGHIDAIQIMGKVESELANGDMLIHRGLYGAQEVIVKSVEPNSDFIRKCCRQMKRDVCVQLANYKLVREIVLLQDLQSDYVLKILGRCVRGDFVSTDTARRGVALVTENAATLSLNMLQSLSWEDKLDVVKQVLALLDFLRHSPLGSMEIALFSVEKLVMTSGKVKLGQVSQLTSEEPSCGSASDCVISAQPFGPQPSCINFHCVGHNSLANLQNAYDRIFAPLLWDLGHDLTERQLEVKRILTSLNASSESYPAAMRSLHQSQFQVAEDEKEDGPLSIFHDLNVGEMQANAQRKEKELIKASIPGLERPYEKKLTKTVIGYKELSNADFPGKHDYNCKNTKTRWGCAVAVQDVEEAKVKCTNDPECKAFVIVPHQQEHGSWMTAFLKNGASGPVHHQGTVAYIKEFGDVALNAVTSNSEVKTVDPFQFPAEMRKRDSEIVERRRALDTSPQPSTCLLGEVLSSQYGVRRMREKRLMDLMGWSGMTDVDWLPLLRKRKVEPSSIVKAEDASEGGGIQLKFPSSEQKAWFKVEPGENRRHTAHVAFFYLDRLLGMFKTVPTTGRVFSLAEMQQAQFPTLLGAVKKRFAAQLTADGSLSGSMSAWINRLDIDIKRKLAIQPRDQPAWAISRLTQEQKDDLEYMLMMWLGGLNHPPNEFFGVQNFMVHFDSHLAMKGFSDDIFQYFNNCQFPRHLIQILGFMHTSDNEGCRLSRQLAQAMQTDPLHLSENDFGVDGLSLLDKGVGQLLEVVSKCTARFGESIVLYD